MESSRCFYLVVTELAPLGLRKLEQQNKMVVMELAPLGLRKLEQHNEMVVMELAPLGLRKLEQHNGASSVVTIKPAT